MSKSGAWGILKHVHSHIKQMLMRGCGWLSAKLIGVSLVLPRFTTVGSLLKTCSTDTNVRFRRKRRVELSKVIS
jgi:uncharacterized membrane protein